MRETFFADAVIRRKGAYSRQPGISANSRIVWAAPIGWSFCVMEMHMVGGRESSLALRIFIRVLWAKNKGLLFQVSPILFLCNFCIYFWLVAHINPFYITGCQYICPWNHTITKRCLPQLFFDILADAVEKYQQQVPHKTTETQRWIDRFGRLQMQLH